MLYNLIETKSFKNLKKNKNFKKPVINLKNRLLIYGAGDMCKMALNFFELYSIKPDYIFDKKVNKIENIKVNNVKYLKKIDKNINICVCLSDNQFFNVVNFLKKMGFKKIFHFYEFTEKLRSKFYLKNGWYIGKKTNLSSLIKYANKFFKDDISKKFYINFLSWHLNRQTLKNLKIIKNIYFNKLTNNFLKKKNNVYLDIGPGYGKSLSNYLKKYSPSKVICIDGCSKVNSFLKRKYKSNKKIKIMKSVMSDRKKYTYFYEKLYHFSKISFSGKRIKTKKVDSLNIKPNIIKIHAEGEELNIIKGSVKTIKSLTPLMLINIYHNREGLIEIFKYVSKFSKNYNFFLRGYSSVGTNYILYCIPK